MRNFSSAPEIGQRSVGRNLRYVICAIDGFDEAVFRSVSTGEAAISHSYCLLRNLLYILACHSGFLAIILSAPSQTLPEIWHSHSHARQLRSLHRYKSHLATH